MGRVAEIQYVSINLVANLQSTDNVIIFVRIINNAIMDVKLTLKLDKVVIDKAKEYAASQKRSLSRMIEAYLKSLIDKENSKSDYDIEISPFIKSMRTGIKIPVDYDYKKAYGDYLDEKYK